MIPITPARVEQRSTELPRLIGASVWIASATEYRDVGEGIERPVAETTPTASELWLPNGLPIAATGVPRPPSPSCPRRRLQQVVGAVDA